MQAILCLVEDDAGWGLEDLCDASEELAFHAKRVLWAIHLVTSAGLLAVQGITPGRDHRKRQSSSSRSQKSVTDKIVCDSQVEVRFAEFLEERKIPLFSSCPGGSSCPLRLATYKPDWAFVRSEADGEYLYLVRETKGTGGGTRLRICKEAEGWKIRSAQPTSSRSGRHGFGDDATLIAEMEGARAS